ncbi:MAG: hypothetical protein J7604_07055 [Sporocytophaga sp.]|uniref:hypothetical protein n=1 Tax=Sporocytophaga sp. TaxID=2231183 RepID=UPI001B22EAC3|nr:hypothetical protein [Sporocytophaga sp.]MBO9699951.1 hypothetical protein [Sporocytophaga sp.]
MIYRQIVDDLLNSYNEIRYVAIYDDNELTSKQRNSIFNNSSADTDRYEELLVNPVILTAARQRGNIDCGGLNFIVIAYGNFFQLIKETSFGHISICLEKQTNLAQLPEEIFDFLKSKYAELFKN